MRLLFSVIFVTGTLVSLAQSHFQAAYQAYPNIPQGLLESVSWSKTRMQEVNLTNERGCGGMPIPYGIMGMFDEGDNYFSENGNLIAVESGISVAEQKLSTGSQVHAFAHSFSWRFIQYRLSYSEEKAIYLALYDLSEIPDNNAVNLFARDLQIYEAMRHLVDPQFAQQHQFAVHTYDLKAVFGADNFKILKSKRLNLSSTQISNESGLTYAENVTKSAQYGPAIWSPAPPCNYSSRSGTPISAITIHTVQGSYAGAISWAQNCASSVSYHYVIRSSDGQITQLVDEANKAWHVGSENPYTIGYEHEGYVDNPAWYTNAMYQESAALSRDIINSGYGIPALRTYFGPASSGGNVLGSCTKIKGHQHYPNQTHTDPGINWNWEKYYRLINDPYTPTLVTAASGTLYDSGGSSANYQDDERLLWLIQPANATTIDLSFTAFNVELNWDYLFIYDGDTTTAPLIGTYTGTSLPPSVSSTTGSLLLEFRSDCATTSPGWIANYSATIPFNDTDLPVTSIVPASPWQTQDFSMVVTDSDQSSYVAEKFYLVRDKDVVQADWSANTSFGFLNETFSNSAQDFINVTGTYSVSNGALSFTDVLESNSNTYFTIDQSTSDAYYYAWKQKISGTGSNQRAGVHIMCSDPTQSNRGDSYLIILRETQNVVDILKSNANTLTAVASFPALIQPDQWYNIGVWYDKLTGKIHVFLDGNYLGTWQDASPLTQGNALSFRSGNCDYTVDDIQVFKKRGGTINLTVGTNQELRHQSYAGSYAGSVLAFSIDSAMNKSLVAEELLRIDWTAPTLVALIDGVSQDIDTTYTNDFSGSWLMEDIHSGITDYEMGLGDNNSTPNQISFVSQGLNTSGQLNLPNALIGTTYYVHVRSTNGAGLNSPWVTDGQLFMGSLSLSEAEASPVQFYPNPATEQFFATVSVDIELRDLQGKLILNQIIDSTRSLDVSHLAKGIYFIQYEFNKRTFTTKLEVL